jgi:hypothetical protein
LRRVVDSWRDERGGVCRNDLALGIEQLHRQTQFQLRRSIEWDLDVGLERFGGVDGGDERLRRDAIPNSHRDVADDSLLRCHDAEVRKLHAALPNLRVESHEPGLGLAERRLRLIELGLADGPRLDERLQALRLLTPVRGVSLGSGSTGLGARHCRLLLRCIDLDERCTNADTLTGLDEHLRDEAVDLWLDLCRTP